MAKIIFHNPRSVPYKERGTEKLYYLSHYLWGRKLYLSAKLIKFINTFLFRNHIHPQVKIGQRLQLAHGGDGTVIHGDTIIGDDAIIFHNVTIANGGARIGNRVTLYTGCVLIGDVKIEDDVTIGANAIVDFNVPKGATVVGKKGIILD